MTKNISLLLLLISLLTSNCKGQTKSNKLTDKKPLDLIKVDRIMIKNYSAQADTINGIAKQLTSWQTGKFVELWNEAESNGPTKYIPKYYIDIHLKDGQVRRFRANGQNIKELNDWSFKIDSDNYFDKLWMELR